MSDSQEMRDQGTEDIQNQTDPDVSLRPAIDVYEDSQGITLIADLPGVSRERLDIQVDGNTLSVEGEAFIRMPEGMEAMYADVKSTRFRRSFTLSNELDPDRINAEIKDGVLTLVLPKRVEVQPRKIEISAG